MLLLQTLLSTSLLASPTHPSNHHLRSSSKTTLSMTKRSNAANGAGKDVGPPWQPSPHATLDDNSLAQSLHIWPLDEPNVNLLNEVHHRSYMNPRPVEIYDLVVIGAGAGGLVSSRQVRASCYIMF